MPVHPKTKKNRPKKHLTNPRKNNRKTAIRIFLNRLFRNHKVINSKLNKSIQMGGFNPVEMVLEPVQKVSGEIADQMAKTITPEVIQDASGCISFMKTVGEKMKKTPGGQIAGTTILGISRVLTMMIETIQFTMGVAKTASGFTKDSVLLIIEPIYNKMQDKIGIDPASFRQLKLKIQSMDSNISKETLFKELQSLPQWNGLIGGIKQNIESLPIPDSFKQDIRNIIDQFISSGTQSGQAGISSSKKRKPDPQSSYTPEQINRAVSVINDIGMNLNDLSPQTMTAILASLLIPYEPESLDLTIKPNEPSTDTKNNIKSNGAPPEEPVKNSGEPVQNSTISSNQIDINIPGIQTLNVSTANVPTVNQAKSMVTSSIIGANSMNKLKQMESMSKENMKKAALGALTQTPFGAKAMNTIKNVKNAQNKIQSAMETAQTISTDKQSIDKLQEMALSTAQSAISQSNIGKNASRRIQSAKEIAQKTQNQMLSAQEAMKSYQQNPKAILNNPLISSQISKQLPNLPKNVNIKDRIQS